MRVNENGLKSERRIIPVSVAGFLQLDQQRRQHPSRGYRYGASSESRRWRHFGTRVIRAGGNKDAVRAAKEGTLLRERELRPSCIAAAMLNGNPPHIYRRD